jgi:hypothetical protein
MSRILIFSLFALLLLSQTGCGFRDEPAYSYRPAPYRDLPVKTVHHQPKNDGYVIVYPLR